MPAARRKPASPPPAAPRLWNIRNAAAGNAVPVIELFGDIGVSKEPDWYWGGEGGAGTFQEFADELKALGNVPDLRVEIHSYGGSVVVGKAMHDKLAEHPANKTAVIYGICASAATYAALACQTVRIPANSFFLIHNSSGFCMGSAEDMRAMGEMLEIADESIANLYAARTGKSVDEIREIMDKDTWMTGAQAVAMGLADEVIEPITIEKEQRAEPDNFRRQALNTMPQDARAWFDTSRLTTANTAPASTPMLNTLRSPLMNAAPAAGGGGPSAPAPAAPVAPANIAPPPATAPTPPPAPAVAAPANAAFTLDDVRKAVTDAFAPLNKRLADLEGLRNAGVGANAWGNQPPVEQAKTGDDAFPTNAAELEVALTKCKNLNERVKLNNEYKKRQSRPA